MRFISAPKILRLEGIEHVGVDYWLDCFENPEKVRLGFEAKSYLDHPINWFNPAITRYAFHADFPSEARCYFCMTILARIFPDPEAVSSWPDMKRVIAKIADEMGVFSPQDKLHPVNEDFLEKFEKRNAGSLDEWNQSFLHGHIWTLIAGAIKRLRNCSPEFMAFRKPYLEVLLKLTTLSSSPNINLPAQSGLLLLTFHSRFGQEHLTQLQHHLRKHLYSVVGSAAKDKASRNLIPLVMLKTLKAGKAVHTAVDHGFGTYNLKGLVFGREFNFPDSSAWVAWKTNCQCQWSYFIANKDSDGTTRQYTCFDLPDSATVDLDTFTEVFLQRMGRCIENAMIDHPFSFGTFFNLKSYLGRPQKKLDH